MIRCIAAIDNKQGIADEHGIPWAGKIPGDVAYFRRRTLGGAVMMGAGWYKEQLKPLPDRRNLVATNSNEPLRPGFEKVPDARTFLQNATKDIWVGGGAGLFASTIDLADELYLTEIDADFHCTKFFPPFKDDFVLIDATEPITENDVTYRMTIWRRK